MSHRRVLVSNFVSLSAVTVANYVLPLVTFPYLVRVLGPGKYGLIAFAQSFVQYFGWVTDYGFNLSATREISIHRNDLQKISRIFCSVMSIKICLMVVCLGSYCVLILTIPRFRQELLLYLFAFATVPGNVIFPVWLFQGLEKMKQIALLNILAKAIFTALVFVVVRSQEDYVYVPLLSSGGYLVAGLISLWIVMRQVTPTIKIPSTAELWHHLRQGWHIFTSSLAISLYTISNPFLLGLLTNETAVGYYSVGDRIVKAFQSLLAPLSQTIYPHISRLASESNRHALSFLRKIAKLAGIPSFCASLATFVFAPQIARVILGPDFQESIAVLRILAFIPFVCMFSNLFAVQGLYAFGKQHLVPCFIIPLAVLHLPIVCVLTYAYAQVGTAIAVLLTETAVTVVSVIVFGYTCRRAPAAQITGSRPECPRAPCIS